MIYISGRISGNKNWKEDFREAENFLSRHGYHNSIVNPLVLQAETEKRCQENGVKPRYRNYLQTDVEKLFTCCDSIYMLRGWWRNRGARLEWHIAKVLGLKTLYQKRKHKG